MWLECLKLKGLQKEEDLLILCLFIRYKHIIDITSKGNIKCEHHYKDHKDDVLEKLNLWQYIGLYMSDRCMVKWIEYNRYM